MDEILNYERNEEEDYYYILGCDELSTEEQILAEYKARVLSCHPDKHPGDATAAEKFQRLQAAKETLADPESRAKYDQWHRSGISMSYSQWRGLRDSVHTSMHWGTVKTKPMLGDGEHPPEKVNVSPKHGQTTLHVSQDTTGSANLVQPESRSPSTSPKKTPWERDTPSQLLQKFRNYEV